MAPQLETSESSDLAALRAAFQTCGSPALDPESCPKPEGILLAVRGELPADELRAVIDHMATCPACAQDWRLAVAFEQELSQPVQKPDRGQVQKPTRELSKAPPAWRPLAVGALAAAAALALAAIGLPWRDWIKPSPPVYRAPERAAIHSLIEEGAALPAESFVLSWTAVPGAATYEIDVTTEALAEVASTKNLATPQFQVPASALAGLPPGTRLYWQAAAVLADGTRIASPTFSALLR